MERAVSFVCSAANTGRPDTACHAKTTRAGNSERTASSTRPLMRKRPNCSARRSLSSNRRRSSMTRHSAGVKAKKCFDLKGGKFPRKLL